VRDSILIGEGGGVPVLPLPYTIQVAVLAWHYVAEMGTANSLHASA